jgi:hypothetical protein
MDETQIWIEKLKIYELFSRASATGLVLVLMSELLLRRQFGVAAVDGHTLLCCGGVGMRSRAIFGDDRANGDNNLGRVPLTIRRDPDGPS